MPVEPLVLTMARVMPVEEVILKGSKVVVPWMLKLTLEDVALTPATVPLSRMMLSAVALGPVDLIRKPLLKEPESLLLKVNQSADDSWPVLVILAVGRLTTKALVEVVMLKMLPAVPVETLLIILLTVMPVLD